MESVTQVQTLYEAVDVSFRASAHQKGINPSAPLIYG